MNHSLVQVNFLFNIDWVVVLEEETILHTVSLDINYKRLRDVKE